MTTDICSEHKPSGLCRSISPNVNHPEMTSVLLASVLLLRSDCELSADMFGGLQGHMLDILMQSAEKQAYVVTLVEHLYDARPKSIEGF